MKLLSPRELKDRKDQDQTREVLRTKQLNDAAAKARENQARAEADFQATLARNLKLWAEEERQHTERIAERETELRALDKEKRRTEQFIADGRTSLDEAISEVREHIKTLHDKEAYNDDLTERLQDKLDDVGHREINVLAIEQRLQAQNKGLEEQQEQIKAQARELSLRISTFHVEQERAEKDIDERKSALFLLDRTLNNRTDALDRKEKELTAWAIQLSDERDTLQREYDRLHIPTKTAKK